jgi:uncharacterized membrane protein
MKPLMAQSAVAFAAVGWLGLILIAPSGQEVLGTAASTGVYMLGSLICHQRPERSFFLHAVQLPVCARCVGLYAGAALACLVAVCGRAPRLSSHRARQILSIAAGPAAGTLVFEWLTGVVPSNAIRAASGVSLGAAIGWLLMTVLAPSTLGSRVTLAVGEPEKG